MQVASSALFERFARNIAEHGLLRSGQGCLLAVSGGLDSMVLLHLVHALTAHVPGPRAVAHFNHGLRGRASDRDSALVEKVAAALGLVVVVGGADVRQAARSGGVSVEMAARDLRHAFFAREVRRLGWTTVLLAHHADDQVEHFFLRLMRGSGTESLAGMRWRGPSPRDPGVALVRPLLNVWKAELKSLAEACGIPFREDATNRCRSVERNRIRLEVLPWLRRSRPTMDRSVLRVAEIIGEEGDCVGAWADAWLKRSAGRPFARLHVALQRRVIWRQLLDLGIRPDFDLIERLRQGKSGGGVTVSHGRTVARAASGRVRLLTAAETVKGTFNAAELDVSLRTAGGVVPFAGRSLRWRIRPIGRDWRRWVRPRPVGEATEYFDAGKVGPEVCLRHWRRGDRFQPMGLAHPVKLQDWFVNRKVPRAQRHALLVATTSSGEIFWVENQRIGVAGGIGPATRSVLVWQWH